MLVRDVLKDKGTEIYSILPDQTVYEAIAKMADLNIGALLVMENDLEGIISERDYRNKVILKGRTSKATPVRDIMTQNVYCVDPGDSVERCLAIMTEKKFRHLPVLENNKVIGVVSIGDLVKAVISRQEVEIKNLRHYIAGSYPG